MECPSCHQTTPDNSRYCCHCGVSLWPGSAAPPPADLHRMVDAAGSKAQQALELKAEQLRTTTVAAAQKDILSWVKIQFWSVAVMVGLLIGFLAFLGYQRYEDFVGTIDQQKEEVGKQAQAAVVSISKTQDSVLEQIEKIERLCGGEYQAPECH